MRIEGVEVATAVAADLPALRMATMPGSVAEARVDARAGELAATAVGADLPALRWATTPGSVAEARVEARAGALGVVLD